MVDSTRPVCRRRGCAAARRLFCSPASSSLREWIQLCIKEGASESRNEGEFVLTYEDKDGDWMLVGEVPWEMFTESCRRLRIMNGSDAIGLAPRAGDKCKNKN